LKPGLDLGRLIPRGEQSGLDKSLKGWISPQMAIMHPSSRGGSEGNNAVTFRMRHGPKIFEIFSCEEHYEFASMPKHDKKQRKNSCGGPASWHLLYPGGGRNHNVIGNSWNCPRASFGDLGLGTASRGQMAEAG
jgi:hypothetical protein